MMSATLAVSDMPWPEPPRVVRLPYSFAKRHGLVLHIESEDSWCLLARPDWKLSALAEARRLLDDAVAKGARVLVIDDVLLPLYLKLAHLHTFERVIVFPFSGAPVPAGVYTLLPARYALQPGAFSAALRRPDSRARRWPGWRSKACTCTSRARSRLPPCC